jgi:hypothetical protein
MEIYGGYWENIYLFSFSNYDLIWYVLYVSKSVCNTMKRIAAVEGCFALWYSLVTYIEDSPLVAGPMRCGLFSSSEPTDMTSYKTASALDFLNVSHEQYKEGGCGNLLCGKLSMEVLAGLFMTCSVFWDITPCSFVKIKRRLWGTYYFLSASCWFLV